MAIVLMSLLYILKIIVFVAAVILLLVLLLLAFVLCTPIKYSVEGKYPVLAEEATGNVSIKWFFGAVKYDAVYQNGRFEYISKFCGRNIADIKNSKKTRKRTARNTTARNTSGRGSGSKEIKIETDLSGNTIDLSRKHKPLLNRHNKDTEHLHEKREDSYKNSEDLDKAPNKKKDKNKFQDKLDKLKKNYRKFKWNLKNICDIIKRIWKLKDKLERLFQKWIHKQTLMNVKKELMYIWNKAKPRVIKLHSRFGFEDPANTGKLLAISGMLIPLFGESDFEVEADFNNAILEVDTQVVGELRLIYIIISIIRLMKDKGNRYTFKVLRKVKF